MTSYTKQTWEDKPAETTPLSASRLGHIEDGIEGAYLDYTPEDSANKGVANGYCPLNALAQVPAENLPSYVDDVLEYDEFDDFPEEGEGGKIYVDLDTNTVWRWGGTTYTQIQPSPGTTDDVPEGSSNLYFTNTRAVNALSTALSGKADTSTTISAGSGLTGGGSLAANRTLSVDFGSTAGTVCQGNDGRLTDARTPTSHQHTVSDINATGTPSSSTFLRGDGKWETPESGGSGTGMTSIVVTSNHIAEAGQLIVCNTEGLMDDIEITLPDDLPDGSIVQVLVHTHSQDISAKVVSDATIVYSSVAVTSGGLGLIPQTLTTFIYSETAESWYTASNAMGILDVLQQDSSVVSLGAIGAGGEPGETTFLRGDGNWASPPGASPLIPLPTSATLDVPGASYVCLIGNFTVDVADSFGGDHITLFGGGGGQPSDVTVEYFDLLSQDTAEVDVSGTMRYDLYYLENIQIPEIAITDPVSGWIGFASEITYLT